MKANPPIRGHELKSEGFTHRHWDIEGNRVYDGGCRCGAHPDDPNWFLLGTHRMRDWHRQHKAALRGETA